MPILSRKILQQRAQDPSPTEIGQCQEDGDQLGGENNNALRPTPSAPINNAPTFDWLRR
tara:strand:- start:15 stop:191 length:177 start_codon:yes stop_codon:yes gene_type:complete